MQLDIYRKRFKALKVLEKCKKHFFSFQNAHNLPSDLPQRMGPSLWWQSNLWHDIVYLCHIWCCIEVHNVTSRSNIMHRLKTLAILAKAKILPVTFLYYEAVSRLMLDVYIQSAPINIVKLFTKTSHIHTCKTRSSKSQLFSTKYSRL